MVASVSSRVGIWTNVILYYMYLDTYARTKDSYGQLSFPNTLEKAAC